MRFETSDNLIDLLVGQSLYSNPDAALRELLQNAQDACHLMKIVDPKFEAEINIKYSSRENYLEVSDNGIGMDVETFERSFAMIGASTKESPRLQSIMEQSDTNVRSIGQFGIGILSCFGVADSVEISTLAEDSDPLAFRIDGPRQEFDELDTHRTVRGTTVCLHMKNDGPIGATDIPGSVSRYVRHATNIWLEDADAQQRGLVSEQWASSSLLESRPLCSDAVACGRLELSEAWDNVNLGLHGRIVLCNGGFLVSDSAHDILPDYAIGFVGEIDVLPGRMTILMNREGFQKDELWDVFCRDIREHYRKIIEEKIDTWIAERGMGSEDSDYRRAVQRAILLMLYSPLSEVVGQRNVEKASRLISQCIDLSSRGTYGLERALSIARKRPPLYVHRRDEETVIDRSIRDRGHEIRFTTPVRSIELRTTLLELNGYAVVETENHRYSVYYRGRQRNLDVHELRALTELASSEGIRVELVKDAPADHTKIGTSVSAEEVTRIMELSSDLKIQSVASVSAGVVQDYNGYILNAAHEDIRRILRTVPDAVGNPIRKGIIAAYFSLVVYDLTKARDILMDLITDNEFMTKARSTTGNLFRTYLVDKIEDMLSDKDDRDA